MKKKVALYVRVSTLEQAESGYSIGEQIDKLKKFADIKDWNVYEVYEDGGWSGSNTNRPALERLINDAKRQLFDTILVYKLDRLSRSQKDTLFLIEDIFKANNIDFVSLNENFDTSTAFGTAMIGILSVFAQLEREQIRERMKLGLVGRAKSGKAMGWHMTPFGYTYDKQSGNFIINNLTASIVREIFNDYLSGISITKLRDKLNESGHIGKDRNWSYRTLRQTLDNPTYTGVVKYDHKIYAGNHEPIIESDVFQAVQIELSKRQQLAYQKNNNPRPFQSKYMLSGIVKCGYCGSPMVSTLGNKRKDGTRLKKYQCVNRHVRKSSGVTIYNNNIKCDSGFYMMADIENYVINTVSDLQASPESVKKLFNKNNNNIEKVNIDEIKKEISKLSSRLKKLSDLYMNDLLSLDELKEKTSELKSTRVLLENKISEDENNSDLEIKERIINNMNKKSIQKMSYQEQSNLVKSLINKVSVTREMIEISWNF